MVTSTLPSLGEFWNLLASYDWGSYVLELEEGTRTRDARDDMAEHAGKTELHSERRNAPSAAYASRSSSQWLPSPATSQPLSTMMIKSRRFSGVSGHQSPPPVGCPWSSSCKPKNQQTRISFTTASSFNLRRLRSLGAPCHSQWRHATSEADSHGRSRCSQLRP